MSDDPLWYKDAVLYQLHVKSFFDSNGDGIGDFCGLTQKLDYVQSLGVDTLWLLPFYPSPLRDDGYDIADYRNVHPSYGTVRDFRAFVREAHSRGLRVITELVINHTSDQHPWFQRARQAPKGSHHRSYYVWSDSDQKYLGTRIIFTDTETSNWAWDPVAQQYYWHRFFSHQPDLNFDNAAVVREVIGVMRWWLDMGVDGMRLDAVPYLCEREGTNCENIPQTHAVLKRLRAALDASHPGRLFLGEANQWPEDVLPYFGDGDECHMAFHFPLMPRMYMAIAREDRHPITDIMRQTPEIPQNCQWAIFLRNHDELTLEMVTDRERDYLYSTYAADPQARINVGIRRRLAPLMDNDRRRIELLNSLLLSMPGTPILYYGDEIGMGDNFYLGDRNGVRTPMQWSEDRNGGFSRADPARLLLPPIQDPVYGFQALNVEAQQRNPNSLLNWMKRLISIRRSRKVFGRGSLRFLYPSNRKVFAYLRDYQGDTILCVANLSRTAQGVELDLSEFKGRVPVEMTGESPFPPIGELPYFLTLPAYAFYWFALSADSSPPTWHERLTQAVAEPSTLVVGGELWTSLFVNPTRAQLEREVLPAFLPLQRWYGEPERRPGNIELLRSAELRTNVGRWLLALLAVRRADGQAHTYFLPLAIASEQRAEEIGGPCVLARIRRGPKLGALLDAAYDDGFALALLEAIRVEAVLPGSDGNVACHATRALAEIDLPSAPEVRRLGVEQSNTSIVVGEKLILKLIRRVEDGLNAEVEMGRYLTEAVRFPHSPPLLGWAHTVDATGRETVLALAFGHVRNQGDAWSWVAHHIQRFLSEHSLLPAGEIERHVAEGAHAENLRFIATLGTRTGQLHRALAQETGDQSFDPEPVTAADLERWIARINAQVGETLALLADVALPEAEQVRRRAERIDETVRGLLTDLPEAWKIRIHGDYHLGQVLVAMDDAWIVDFEGEPRRSLAERRTKDSPLRDVAGMLRSFDYAAWSTLMQAESVRPGAAGQLQALAMDWRDRARDTFLAAYRQAGEGCSAIPREHETFNRLVAVFLIEKACYEIAYEAVHRPSWLVVPLRGLISLLAPEEMDSDGTTG
jgi:maltose alpha-D-glucosyltransferase/alpha-amylase